QYWEVPAGQPKAMRAWFYPGDNFGQEFAYHKQTAVQIATFDKAPVPAIEVDTRAEEDLKTAPVVVVDEGGKTSELAVAEPAPLPEPVQTAAAAPTAAVEPEQTLPHTASGMPLLGLL